MMTTRRRRVSRDAVVVTVILAVAISAMLSVAGARTVTGCPSQEPGGTEQCVTEFQWRLW
jgi:hypothetical protein